MPALGFQYFDGSVLGRVIVGAAPQGEMIVRPHFGPMADRLITDRPVFGPAALILSRADLVSLAGVEFCMTDLPAGRLSRWYCDGTTLRPMHPITLFTLAAPVAGIATAGEQSTTGLRVLIPAKAWGDNSKIRITTTAIKPGAGVTNALRLYVHLGANGTTADTTVFDSGSGTYAAAALAVSEVIELQRVNATTIQVNGTSTGVANASNAAAPANVTVTSLDTTAQYVTLGVQTGTTDAPTVRSLVVELIP